MNVTITTNVLVKLLKVKYMDPCEKLHYERGLLFTFIERWHKETKKFHMSINDITITQDDVS